MTPPDPYRVPEAKAPTKAAACAGCGGPRDHACAVANRANCLTCHDYAKAKEEAKTEA